MKRLSLPYYYTRTGSKYESTHNFIANSIEIDTNKDKLDIVGVPIAQIDHDTYATTKDEMHCFVVGETGCGKTRRVILPTIRLLAKTGESMVISDPKGELHRYTSDTLRKKGYDVKVLNFRKPRCGNRWNPLSMVEELCSSDSLEDKDKGWMILDDIVSILSSGIESSEDPYWAISAANVFRGGAQLILKYGKKGDLTFENLSKAVKAVYGLYSRSSSYITGEKRMLKEHLSSLGNESTIIQNLSSIIVNGDTTRDCIMSMFDNMISDYCKQELLLDLFSKSEINIADIGKKPTALYFILPDDTDAMYPIATCFVKQVYSALISLADEQADGRLPNRVTFLLDEFANFAKIPTIHAMLTAARSRKIRFVLVCQSMDQLIEKYKTEGMEIMLSNCRVWIYMSCRNFPFLERLVQLSGQHVSPYTNESYPLVSIDSLQHLSMGQVLVFNDRCRPFIGYLEDYGKYDFGSEGPGIEVDTPEAHEVLPRSQFSLHDAVKAYIDAKETEDTFTDNEESAETSWRINPTVARTGDSDGDSDGDTVNFDEELLTSLFDDDDEADAGDGENKETKSDEFSALDIAKGYVLRINNGFSSVDTKNNLAYLIRHDKLDTSQLNANFDLSLPELLREGVEAGECFSLMNKALYHIERREYAIGLLRMTEIKSTDFKELTYFWFYDLWHTKMDVEGAFVSYICVKKSGFSPEFEKMLKESGAYQKMLSEASKVRQYSEFLADLRVKNWLG